jgi:hypothetical protein
MAAHRQLPAGAQDQSVFDGARNFPDIHDPVRSNQIFSRYCRIHVLFYVSWLRVVGRVI